MARLIAAVLLAVSFASAAAPAAPKETNQYLKNLFRIEQAPYHQVFRRKPGTASIILVAPQGEKYYATKHPDGVRWFSNDELDIVYIPHPPLGPWQAIGEVIEQHNFQGVSFAKPQWSSPRYVGEKSQVCQRITERAGVLKPAELADLVDSVTWLTSQHRKNEDNFSFSSTAKQPLLLQGEQYCASVWMPPLPGHYSWQLTDTAGLDKGVFSKTVALAPLPFALTPEPAVDELTPMRYQAALTVDDIDPTSVRFALVLHVGNNQQVHRILRLDEQGRGTLRYLPSFSHNVAVTGTVRFNTRDGKEHLIKLPRRLILGESEVSRVEGSVSKAALVPAAPPKPAPESSSLGYFVWLWLILPVLLILGIVWWRLRPKAEIQTVPEKAPEAAENEAQVEENDDFLLDLSRPDDIDEKN